MPEEDNSLDASGGSKLYDTTSSSLETTAPVVQAIPARRRPSLFKFNRLAFTVTGGTLAAIAIIVGLAFLFNQVQNSKANEIAGKKGSYDVSTISTNGIQQNDSLKVGTADSLDVNGQLQVSNTVVLTPTTAPTTPEAGQIYYDKTLNSLFYYNGSVFVPVANQNSVVSSLGGLTGAINPGAGLSAVGGSLQNTGVLSVQGQTGNVTFTAGGGVEISGTTISTVALPAGQLVLGTGASGFTTVAQASGAGQCLISTTGAPVFGSCTGSTQVTSLNGLINAVTLAAGTGVTITPAGNTLTIAAPASAAITSLNSQTGPALTVANASGSGNTITIDNAAADGSTKGIAAFNATNFSASSGVINTIQGISTSASPTFANLTSSGYLKGTALRNATDVVFTLPVTGSGASRELCYVDNTNTSNCPTGGDVSFGTTHTTNKIAALDGSGNLVDSELATLTGGLQYAGSGYLLDLVSGSTSTLTVDNSGAGVANLTVSGKITATQGFLQATDTYTLPTNGGNGGVLCYVYSGSSNCPTGGNISQGTAQTAGRLAKYDSVSNTITNSLFGDDGTTLTAYGNLNLQNFVLSTDSITSSSGGIELDAGTGGSDTITFYTANGANSFILPTTGGLGQTICTTAITCASGGGQAVILEPGVSPQSSAAATAAIFINKTLAGTGNLIQLQSNGADKFVINNKGEITSLLFNGGTAGTDYVSLSGGTQTGSATLTIPDLGGVNRDVCLSSGNCIGSGVGVGGSGTTDTIAMFTASGTIGNSTLTQSGGNLTASGDVIVQGGDVTLGVASSQTGSLSFKHSASAFTGTVIQGSLSGNQTYTLPDSTGDFCLSSGNCIGGGGGGAPNGATYLTTSLDGTLTAERVLTAGTNISVSDGGANSTFTVSVSSTPTFSGLVTANGGLTVEAGDTFTFNGDAFTDLTGTGLQISAGSLQTTLGTSVDLTSEVTGTLAVGNGGTGATTLALNGILYGNGSSAIQATAAAADSVLVTNGSNVPSLSQTLPTAVQGNITSTGALASGSIASGFGTISTGNNISTTADVQGANVNATTQIQLGGADINVAGTLNNVAYLNAGTNNFTGNASIQGALGLKLGGGLGGSPGVLGFYRASGGYVTLQALDAAGSYTLDIPAIVANDTLCLQTAANCSGGVGAIGALDGQTKSANGAVIDTATLYLQSADASFPGLVTTGTQTLAGAKTFSGAAVFSAAGTGLTVNNNASVLGSGGLTVGVANSVQGKLVLATAGAGSITIQAPSLASNYSVSIPGTITGNDTLCLQTANNCAGTAPTLQTAYTNSTGGTTPEIKLDSTRGGLDIQDADSTIGASLLNIRGSNGGGLGTVLASIGSTGNALFQASTNSANAFRVQNAGGTTLLAVDTNGGEVESSRLIVEVGNASSALEVTQNSTGDIIDATDAGTSVFTVADGGASLFRNSVNSAAAFRIQNAAGTSLFNADTTNSGVSVTSSATTTTGFAVQGNSVTTGSAASIAANALTTGSALSVTSSSSAITTGSLAVVAQTGSFSGPVAVSGNGLQVSRSIGGSYAGGAATVTLDAIYPISGYATSTAADPGVATWNHTVGGFSNRALVVTISAYYSPLPVSCTVTYGGTPLTQAATSGSLYATYTQIYVLTSPAIGTAQVAISCPNGLSGFGGLVEASSSSWYNVNQATPYVAATSLNSNSINVTTVANDMAIVAYASLSAHTTGAGQTDIQPCTADGLGTSHCSSYELATGVSTTMSYSGSAVNNTITAIALKQSTSAVLGVEGAVASFSSNCTATGCADQSNVINLNQQYASATGAVLAIQNAGTGADIQLGRGVIQTAAGTTSSTAVSILSGNASAGTSGTLSLQTGTGTTGTGVATLQSGNASAGTSGAVNVKSGTGTTSTGIVTLQSGNASAGTSGNVVLQSGTGTTSTGTVTLQSGNGSAGSSGNVIIDTGTATTTAGNILIGTGAYAHNVTVGNTTGTSAITLQTGTAGTTATSTASTGTAFAVQGNSLTTGNGLSVSSTSANITSGNLAYINQTSTMTTPITLGNNLLNVSRAVTANIAASPAVALDNVNNGTSGSTSFSWTHTVGSYTNRALVVNAGIWISSVTTPTCTATYGGVAMTQLAAVTNSSGSFTYTAIVYGLAAPAIGSATVQISCNAGTTSVGASSSWYNVDQSTPFSGATTTAPNNTTATLNVTGTTTSDKVVDTWWSIGTSKSPTAPQTGYGSYSGSAYASYRDGTASPTSVSWTTNQSGQIAYAATAVKAVATASTAITGSLASLSSNCTVSSGGCADSANILNINQQYSSSTGVALKITNAGSGGAILAQATSTSALTIQNQAGSSTLLNADTTNMRVSVGTKGTATGQLYISGQTPSAVLHSSNGQAASFGLDVQGRYAYTTPTGTTGGLQVYDISNPASLAQFNTAVTTTGTSSKRVKVQGKYAYVAGWLSSTNGVLQVYDISNPKAPTSVGTVNYTGSNNTPALYVQGRYAYVGDNGSTTMSVIDVTNPAAMSVAGTVTLSTGAVDIVAQGRYVYVANSTFALNTKPLQIIDMSNPASPTVVGQLNESSANVPISGAAASLEVQDAYAYIGTATGNLYVIDVKDPTTPTVATSLAALGSNLTSIVAQGRQLYVGDLSLPGIRTVDISIPASATAISGTVAAQSPQRLVANGRYLFVANNSATNTLQSFDMGGAYAQQLEVGGLESNTLSVRGNSSIAGDESIQGSLSIGGNAQIQGNVSISGETKHSGNLIAGNYATSTTATTSGTGTDTTTLTFSGTTSFADGDVVLIDNAGQDYYTRIVSGGTAASVTVSPAVTFETGRTVTKYIVQNIGAISTSVASPSTNDRFFQGYFLGGVVTGAGSTTLSDGRLQSSGSLSYVATGHSFTSTNSTTTGISLASNSITTGNGLNVSSSSSSLSSGNVLSVTQNGTYDSTISVSGSTANITRSITAPANDAVTLDSIGSTGSGNSSMTATLVNVGNNPNRALLFTVGAWKFSSLTPSCSVTYNGNPVNTAGLTLISNRSVSNGTQTWHRYMWGVVAPSTGSAIFAVTCSNTDQIRGVVSSWYNVDQTTPFAGSNGNTGTASSGSTSVSGTTTKDIVIDSWGGAGTLTLDGTPFGQGAASPYDRDSYKPGVNGSTTTNWSSTSSTLYAYSAIAVKALPTRTLTVSGAAASISSNCNVGTGICNDSSNVLNVTQSYASATGTALLVQNAGSGAGFQVQNASAAVALSVSTANLSAGGWNASMAVLRVAKDTGTNRSISAAGTVDAGGLDYAEYIPWTGVKPDPGTIISYHGQSMVVSSVETAAFIGSGGLGNTDDAILVAFAGQVPVKINGPVNSGDYLVPNGDGTARGVAPASATFNDYLAKVGTALETTSAATVKALVSGPGSSSEFNPQATNSFADLNVSGNLTVNNLEVSGTATFNGNIIVGGHVITAGDTPDTQVLGAAGAGATITIDGNDTAGTITITTGGGATAGDLGRLIFSNAFGKAPKTILSAQDEASQDAKIFPSGKSASQFILRTSQALPAGTYTFDYFIVQ